MSGTLSLFGGSRYDKRRKKKLEKREGKFSGNFKLVILFLDHQIFSNNSPIISVQIQYSNSRTVAKRSLYESYVENIDKFCNCDQDYNLLREAADVICKNLENETIEMIKYQV